MQPEINDRDLRLLWNALASAAKSEDEEKRLVSTGLDRYADLLNTDKFSVLPVQDEHPVQEIDVEPAFQNLNDAVLTWLRRELLRNGKNDKIEAWAEKLMRFCEVRKPVLRKKALEKWNDSNLASLNMRKLTVFFLDYYLRTDDLRFFNTALKLGDMKWILNKKSAIKAAGSPEASEIGRLLQIKIAFVPFCEIIRLASENTRKTREEST